MYYLGEEMTTYLIIPKHSIPIAAKRQRKRKEASVHFPTDNLMEIKNSVEGKKHALKDARLTQTLSFVSIKVGLACQLT